MLSTIIVVPFLSGNLLAEEGGDQEWVISFDIQQRNNYIWDGRRTEGTEKLEEEYNELKEIQNRYRLNPNIFIIDGYYCTDTHLKTFAPQIHNQFVELNSKLESLKSDAKLASDSTRLVTLNKEIQQLRALLPPKIDFENYLWHTYCRGLEEDVDARIVVPQADCSCCKGTGKIPCRLCGGKGKVGFYNPSIDVIDPDSKTRKEYRRRDRERNKKYYEHMKEPKRSKKTTRNSSPSMPGMMGSFGRLDGESEKEDRREEILRKKEEDKRIRQAKMEERRRKNKQIECAICKGRGWCACPNCVLVDKPQYATSAKILYMPRWGKLKSEKWH
ncbi:MAG: hypothetical protein DRP56_07465 [Planctomycetota bacterium]|nr:MAG: hypothetical protein DRP56_07465 [Planctomycetota bacterium]